MPKLKPGLARSNSGSFDAAALRARGHIDRSCRLTGRPRTLSRGGGGGLAFLHVVAIPLGDLDDVGAGLLDDGLAAEAAVQLHVGGGLHAVELLVLGLADALGAFLDPEGGGRA